MIQMEKYNGQIKKQDDKWMLESAREIKLQKIKRKIQGTFFGKFYILIKHQFSEDE